MDIFINVLYVYHQKTGFKLTLHLIYYVKNVENYYLKEPFSII